MWIPKWVRDRKKGIETAVPTQVVSNEELVPRPQSRKQKQIEAVIGELAEQKAKMLGMDRRGFMSSSMGIATCFMASNIVWGKKVFAVEEIETLEAGAYEDLYPKSEYFIMDVQSHFTNGVAIGFRNAEFVKNMGFNLKGGAEAYAFPNFVKEMFFDSETAMLVISGVPSKEDHYDKDGNPAEGAARTPGFRGRILPSWLMSMRKKDINDMAGGVRALCQGNCAPNHYWDMKTNSQDKTALFEQMEREVKLYGIDS